MTETVTEPEASPANTLALLEQEASDAAEEAHLVLGRIQVQVNQANLEVGKLEVQLHKWRDYAEGAKEDPDLSEQERAEELRTYDARIRELREEKAALEARYEARLNALREDHAKATERARKARNKLERLRAK